MTPALSTETIGPGSPAGLRESWRARALVMLAVVAFYVLVVGLSVRHYGGNLSSLVDFGTRYTAQHPGSLGHRTVIFRDSDGYDGQAFYYVASDPFLRTHAFPNPFRYQRIVYPLLIWAVSLGQRDARPLAMVAINIVAVVALLSGLILLRYGRGASPWWALACAINPSLILGGILTHGVAAIFASSNIMLAYASAARVFGGHYPLTIFAFTRQRTRAFTVLAAVTILLTIFTFIRLVIVSPTLPYYVTP